MPTGQVAAIDSNMMMSSLPTNALTVAHSKLRQARPCSPMTSASSRQPGRTLPAAVNALVVFNETELAIAHVK